MDAKLKNNINNVLFICLLVMTLTWRKCGTFIYVLFSAFQSPIDQFIIPGILFYWRYRDQHIKENFDVSRFIKDIRKEKFQGKQGGGAEQKIS
jgi:hypothetical protein